MDYLDVMCRGCGALLTQQTCIHCGRPAPYKVEIRTRPSEKDDPKKEAEVRRIVL